MCLLHTPAPSTQHNPTQRNTTQHNTAQHSTTQQPGEATVAAANLLGKHRVSPEAVLADT